MGPSLTDIPRRLDAADKATPADKLVTRVLRNCDGRRDLKRIAVTCGISEDAVLIVADDLIQSGLIEVSDSSRLEQLEGRRRGRSSGMYSQVSPSDRPRRSSQPTASSQPVAGGKQSRQELDPGRRAEIDEAYSKLDSQNYYGLLGVPEDAPKGEIRDAYFKLSKRFHPDSLFGIELGEYRTRMEAVFRRLTDAYDTLGRSKRRARYNRDHHIKAIPREDQLSEQPTAQHVAPDQRGAASEAPTARFRRLSDEEKKARRELHTKKLLAVTQHGEGRYRMPSRPTVPAVEAPSMAPPALSSKPAAAPRRSAPHSLKPKGQVSQATRDLARSLKETSQTTGGVSRAETYLRDAHRSAENGDYRGAVNAARLALNADPARDDIRELFSDFTAKLKQVMASEARTRAELAEKSKDWPRAAEAWKEYCDAAPDDLGAHLRAVEAGLQSDPDLAVCKRLAQRAVELEPDDIGARRLLARVFVAAGMKLNAKRELKKALSLDPNDKISEDLLRTLG